MDEERDACSRMREAWVRVSQAGARVLQLLCVCRSNAEPRHPGSSTDPACTQTKKRQARFCFMYV